MENIFGLTRDLDIHCNKKEVWIDFYTNIESVLNMNDRGYIYKITKRRSQEKGLNTSDSLTFSLNDDGKAIQFKMDMNIKGNHIITVHTDTDTHKYTLHTQIQIDTYSHSTHRFR